MQFPHATPTRGLILLSPLTLFSAANAQNAAPSVVPTAAPTSTPTGASTGAPTGAPARSATSATPKAATNQPYKIGDWTISGSLRGRVENWDWFSTPGFDDNYTFGATLLRLGAVRQTKNTDFALELSQPTLFGLPDNAIAPPPRGQLGVGATYKAANGGQDGSLFLKTASVKFKNLGSAANSLRLGRFEFDEGLEVLPKDPTLAWLKKARIADRLIGNFGFTHVQRSFDGGLLSHNDAKSNITMFLGAPTEGVFQLNGMGEVKDVYAFYGAYTKPMKSADARLFYIRYHDGRNLTPVDNRAAALRALDKGDIDINNFGANYLKTFDLSGGKADVLAWGSYQTGSWGSQSHRADALALEAGYQPKNVKWKPWFRAGYFNGSGDNNPEAALGGKHETFFQILPTPRVYARFPFYNLMNNEDIFVQAIAKPNKKTVLRSDIHRVRLSSAGDLWYSGGGAFNDGVFGFPARPSGGNSDLATVFDLSADYNFNSKTALGLYAAHASGGGVIGNVYPAGKSGNYFYLEMSRKF